MIRLFGKDIFLATTHDHDQVAESSNSPPQAATSSSSSSSGGKKKRKPTTSELPDERRKKPMREKYEQVPTVELSPKFQELIGNRVVFVYRKKLTPTDVDDSQNRLLVTRKEKLLGEYLTAEEREAFVERDVNIDGIAIDKKGTKYRLRLAKWGKEKKTTVFNEGWGSIVAANEAEAGHWVDLWGFRRPNEPRICFAVNFST